MKKANPLNLNALQLKTLTLLQAVAEIPEAAQKDAATGHIKITALPHAHGNHFHVGRYTVDAADATGLQNAGVWAALTRKGLVEPNFPHDVTLTRDGAAYDTGMREQILHAGHD
jgi:hypothetical protein